MVPDLIPNFRSKLRQAYQNALASGEVIHIPTDLIHVTEDGVDFEVRHAKSLQAKPMPVEGGESKPKTKKKDPFALPIGDHSLICEYDDVQDGEGFRLLLNKFAVVPGHFLLCTKEFIPQESPLSPSELYTSYRILQQFNVASGDEGPAQHAMFFNCGEHSGASQPHKHLQFIKLDTGSVPFEPCIQQSRPSSLRPGETYCLPSHLLPTAHQIADTRLASNLDSAQAKDLLITAYLGLLDDAIQNLRLLSAQGKDAPDKLSSLSYNLILTSEWMMLVPRSSAEYYFDQSSGEDKNKLSLNSLAFAGMIMVKYEEQLEFVKNQGCRKVLAAVGFERAEQVDAEE